MAETHGLLEATTNADQIRSWWGATPDANVAINCGQSDLFVVDVDPRHGGDETWHELIRKHGQVETLTCLTPSGGAHYYFMAGDHKIASGESVLGPGVDHKSLGGYVAAPPSQLKHGAYVWEVERGPREVQPQPLPAWIVRLAQRSHIRTTTSVIPEKIPSGCRHDRLFRLGAMVRDRGANEQELAALLGAVNEGRCQPPLPNREVLALAYDLVRRYEPKRDIFASGELA